MTLADCRQPLFACRMIYWSSPAVVILGRPPPTVLTAVPVVWNAFQARENDTFVDSGLCSYTGDAPIMADKDILQFVQSSKNVIHADSDDENKINVAAPVPTSSEMRNIMKSMPNYFDAHCNG
ncbi:hypothetical protein TNCV_4289261 [Trichonephila clavipes]|nr:hypothetical protein TNCV_4289261 [Trichonephila clavipes]